MIADRKSGINCRNSIVRSNDYIPMMQAYVRAICSNVYVLVISYYISNEYL